MVWSAGLSVGDGPGVTVTTILTSRSAVYLALAVAALFGASRVPMHRMAGLLPRSNRAAAVYTAALLLVVISVYVPGLGHAVNGSHRWIRLPLIGLTFQPSEIAKWGAVVLIAWFGWRHGDNLPRFRRGLLVGLAFVAPIAALVALEDLGTGVLIALVASVLLLAAGARVWHFAALAPIGLLAVFAAIVTSPYRVRRLTAFVDPYADPQGAGYHMIQSLVAIANGKVAGRGLGFGLQKFGYLPEDRTDFLFAVICEELGVWGAFIVSALILTVVWCGISIVRRQRDVFLQLLGLGVVLTFGIQAMMNLAVVTGLAPTKGIALPLLSSGGTGWILTAGSLGLLVAMDRVSEAQLAARPDADDQQPMHDHQRTGSRAQAA